MGVGCSATLAVFLEAEVVDDSQNWLEEQEDENDYADDWMVVIVLCVVSMRSFALVAQSSTYEIETKEVDRRGHPDTKTERNDVEQKRK